MDVEGFLRNRELLDSMLLNVTSCSYMKLLRQVGIYSR